MRYQIQERIFRLGEDKRHLHTFPKFGPTTALKRATKDNAGGRELLTHGVRKRSGDRWVTG